MNILAVGANPDDVEFLCAGTLALDAQRGDAIAISFLTNGDKGSADLSLLSSQRAPEKAISMNL